MRFIFFNWTPILLPFFVGLFCIKNFSKPLKVLFLFICYGTFNEILNRTLIWVASMNNTLPLVHLYGFFSFGLLFTFYFFVLDDLVNKKIYVILSSLFIVYWAINSLFIQSLFEIPAIPRSLGNILVIILSILYFYKVMMEAKIVKLADEPLIWINTAMLIYYTGSLFFFVLFNLILEYSREFSKLTVQYFSVLNALFYILIAIGFLKAGKRKPSN